MDGATLNQKSPNWQDKVLSQAKQAEKLEAAVGFPRGKEGLGSPHYEGGASILQVAIWNNFGFGVPRRPFMFVASKQIHEMLVAKIKATLKKINAGKTDGGKELEIMAIAAQGKIQEVITDSNFAPNAPATIKKKGSNKPLIDSGDMRKAVTYVVREK